MMEYRETMHDHYGQVFEVSRVVFRQTTPHHDLVIFENPLFGRVLALNGSIQTTSRDNHVYHEMFAHVPILAHGRAESVLVVGGGDGGSLREVLKHPLRRAVLVDIDRAVIDLCTAHMPELPQGAFADPRAEIVIADGFDYMAGDGERFDVIVVDSTDPEPASEPLFSAAFYAACHRRPGPRRGAGDDGGHAVPAAGGAGAEPRGWAAAFADASFYFAQVPSYTGGALAYGWATDDTALRGLDRATIAGRLAASAVATAYSSAEIHVARLRCRAMSPGCWRQVEPVAAPPRSGRAPAAIGFLHPVQRRLHRLRRGAGQRVAGSLVRVARVDVAHPQLGLRQRRMAPPLAADRIGVVDRVGQRLAQDVGDLELAGGIGLVERAEDLVGQPAAVQSLAEVFVDVMHQVVRHVGAHRRVVRKGHHVQLGHRARLLPADRTIRIKSAA
ncbi:MAG: hypothetical protein R3F55_02275 [Alphaproteobacteria bacterium]